MRTFLAAAALLVLDLASTVVFALVLLWTKSTAVAVLCGVLAGAIQIGVKVTRRVPVHTMEWFSLALIVSSGAATLLTDDPRFILFKPSAIYAAVGLFMLRPGWMLRYLPPLAQNVAADVATRVGTAWAVLMFVSAAVNAAVAITFDVATWTLVMTIFSVASKALLFAGGFAAIRMTAKRRIRAMAPEEREALLARYR